MYNLDQLVQNKFFYYLKNSIMMKKKDKLFESLTKIKTQQTQAPLFLQFLSDQDLLSMSILNRKYCLHLLPFLKVRQLDTQQADSKNQTKQKTRKKNKGSNPTKKSLLEQSGQQQVQVSVEKIPITKWKSKFGSCSQNFSQTWHRIESLPFYNGYLNKKLQTRSSIFYQHNETKQIIYLNRSMVDPNLDFQKGSFDDQIDNDIYEEMYKEDISELATEIDFSSRDTLLKRQKDMLERINKRKAQNQEAQIISYERQLQKAVQMKRFAIILCFGGSFSLGIYEGEKCILHKSDKKYVCRKKAGQRQLNKDKQSGSSIKSMGSQIRRDQEKKHVINVNQILNENEQVLTDCEIIFLQAPGINRLYIINTNETMAKLQSKLRSVCLTAKKANFTEVSSIIDNINKFNIVKVKE